jgi:hypothetical protein
MDKVTSHMNAGMSDKKEEDRELTGPNKAS